MSATKMLAQAFNEVPWIAVVMAVCFLSALESIGGNTQNIQFFRECPPCPQAARHRGRVQNMISADIRLSPYFAAFSGAGAGFSPYGRPFTDTICKSLSALKDL